MPAIGAVRFTIFIPFKPSFVYNMKPFACLICVCLLAAVVPARAEVDRVGASAVAQQATGGRVLAVDKAERAGRLVWRVKVLTAQGEVRLLLVDAASGRLQ